MYHEVRVAATYELKQVVAMARRFHEAVGSQYPFQSVRVAEFIRDSIVGPYSLVIVSGDDPHGFLIARKGISYLTGEVFAEEVALWIDPGYRTAGLASRMIDLFELWAVEQGCSIVKLTSQHSSRPQAVSRLYRRKGYQEAETAFIRRV